MKSPEEYEFELGQAVAAIQKKWSRRPRVGLVLGTGSGAIAQAIAVEQRWPFGSLPHFAPSTALGHQGAVVCGVWNDVPVVAMQGRLHFYEGRTLWDTMRPVQVLARLGVERLLICNAAGGVSPSLRVGDLMVITSFIDLFFRPGLGASPQPFSPVSRGGMPTDWSCDETLIERALTLGRAHDLELKRGVYVGLLGPCYETRAEYRMCRRIGADAVGMSTIPEIIVATAHRIPVLAISIITNSGIAPQQPISGHAVIENAEAAAGDLREIFAGMLPP